METYNNYVSLIEQIPFFQRDLQIFTIQKGYSSDQKYLAVKNKQKYVIRIFDYQQYPNKQAEYDVLMKMQEFGVKCSRPIGIGGLKQAGLGYMILSYIEGKDAEEELPKCPAETQYRIGLEAGNELRTIHRHGAPARIASWFERKTAKHRRYVMEYGQQSVKLKNDSRILSFIEDNLSYMKDRPNRLQHDDFHVGNLLVKRGRLSGVIDFNRFDWGDPVHEFLKVGMFSAGVSAPFAIGQMKGYHQNVEPDERFWRLYALYVAMCLISSIVWIQKVKPEETDEMLAIIDRVMEDHRGFENVIPGWYV